MCLVGRFLKVHIGCIVVARPVRRLRDSSFEVGKTTVIKDDAPPEIVPEYPCVELYRTPKSIIKLKH